MRHILFVITFLSFSCLPTTPTYPPNSHLCRQNTDCFDGQYCGFQPGYTAAICRGQAISDKYNLN